ncbi:hypothetical protein ABT160_40325 [Streptomyces sp. NPDC001941]|uniref:hypothetical protein n=1 Tax=Streptomyces sp. NPDC001941 TaxID=3154659 RepID=UPI0033207527
MIVIAVLLLPALGLVLFAMDHCEDWIVRKGPEKPRHAARAQHLRLVDGVDRPGDSAEPATRRLDAA